MWRLIYWHLVQVIDFLPMLILYLQSYRTPKLLIQAASITDQPTLQKLFQTLSIPVLQISWSTKFYDQSSGALFWSQSTVKANIKTDAPLDSWGPSLGLLLTFRSRFWQSLLKKGSGSDTCSHAGPYRIFNNSTWQVRNDSVPFSLLEDDYFTDRKAVYHSQRVHNNKNLINNEIY